MRSGNISGLFLSSLSLLVAFLWLPPLAHGAPPPSPVEWHLGMNLVFYIASDTGMTTTCPATADGAAQDSGLLPIWTNDGKIMTTKPVVAGPKASTSFRLLNGWQEKEGSWDSSSQTFVKASEPFGVGGKCWFGGNQAAPVLVEAPCGTDEHLTKFYIEKAASPGNMHRMTQADLRSLTVNLAGNALVAVNKKLDPNICVYHHVSGALVVPPESNFHVPVAQLTNLIGQTVPPSSQSTDQDALPGCNLDGDQTIDCIISLAYNKLPVECQSNPHLAKCVLRLTPPFCGDLPARRFKQDASAEVEVCMHAVHQGPCIANPAGAACASGLFAGIRPWVSGGGQVGKKLRARSEEHSLERRSREDDIFGPPESNLPLYDQFMVGAMKSIINGFINLVNLFKDGLVYSARQQCYGMTFALGGQSAEEVNKIREGCSEVFQPHKPIPTLAYDGDIEQAGGIFADVVQILFAVNDLAQAASASKWVGRIGEVMEYFKPAKSGAGLVLEAEGKGGSVQLFNDYGDGMPKPFFTENAVQEMKESTEYNAFNNCYACTPTNILNPRGPKKWFCCKTKASASSSTSTSHKGEYERVPHPPEMGGPARTPTPKELAHIMEQHVTIDEPVALENRQIGKAIAFSEDVREQAYFGSGLESFKDYYMRVYPNTLRLDPGIQRFYEELNKMYLALSKKPKLQTKYTEAFMDASRKFWGLTLEEQNALKAWADYNVMDNALVKSAFNKMNPYRGWTISNRSPPRDIVEMLKDGDRGIKSKGPPGEYKLSDLTGGLVSTPHGPNPVAFSASIGMFPAYQTAIHPVRFVILSKTGRYIAPVAGTKYHEVLFHEEVAGTFKLLGFHESNGGWNAMESGKPGPPYAVFYFREVVPENYWTKLLDPPDQPIFPNIG